MVDYNNESLDNSLYALSDPTRRAMLARLVANETTVTELAQPFTMSLAAISKHLQVLERADLITKIKNGRTITCRANLAPLKAVSELLEELGRYWNKKLDSLETYLATTTHNKEKKDEKPKKRKSSSISTSPIYSRKKR